MDITHCKKKHEIKEAFTLVEVLVYTAVFVIIMVAVSSFLLWAIQLQARSNAMREVLENTERVMNRMVFEIRGAMGIYWPTTTSTQLSLQTPRYLPPDETFSYIDFFICENRLCLKKEPQNPPTLTPPVALTSDNVEITNINFLEVATASSTPSMQITLTAKYKNPNNRPELDATVTLTSAASLRAY